MKTSEVSVQYKQFVEGLESMSQTLANVLRYIERDFVVCVFLPTGTHFFRAYFHQLYMGEDSLWEL